MIDNMIEETNNIISRLVGAVFGRFGQSQDVIPDEMRRGGVDSKHANPGHSKMSLTAGRL